MVELQDIIKKVQKVEVEDTFKFNSKIIKILIVVISILGLLFKFCYRPFIYKNNLSDLGIADCSPNFFCNVYIMCYHCF